MNTNTDKIIEKPDKIWVVDKKYTKTVIHRIENEDGELQEIEKEVVIGTDGHWEYTDPDKKSVAAAANAIETAKKYLSETDYIVLKIAEAQAEGNTEAVTALCAEYAEQLSKRKQARETVNANEENIIALQKSI